MYLSNMTPFLVLLSISCGYDDGRACYIETNGREKSIYGDGDEAHQETHWTEHE